ncbi:MAG: hypothetical protein NC393_04160 [Clostridium sp.]|nr:hypothetical protein [Clostridium sp.]
MSSSKISDAKKILNYYFCKAWKAGGLSWDSDNEAEINAAVDEMVTGIKAEMRSDQIESTKEEFVSAGSNKIYTHDEAMLIVGLFEGILDRYDIKVPSPEDEEREADNLAGLFGSTYDELLTAVEEKLCELLDNHKVNTEIIKNRFSGTK